MFQKMMVASGGGGSELTVEAINGNTWYSTSSGETRINISSDSKLIRFCISKSSNGYMFEIDVVGDKVYRNSYDNPSVREDITASVSHSKSSSQYIVSGSAFSGNPSQGTVISVVYK